MTTAIHITSDEYRGARGTIQLHVYKCANCGEQFEHSYDFEHPMRLYRKCPTCGIRLDYK